jgi:hypothetical protein
VRRKRKRKRKWSSRKKRNGTHHHQHAPLHMEGLQGKGREMKGKRRRKKMNFCLKNEEVMRVVIERTWF